MGKIIMTTNIQRYSALKSEVLEDDYGHLVRYEDHLQRLRKARKQFTFKELSDQFEKEFIETYPGALTSEEESLARTAMEYTARMTGILK